MKRANYIGAPQMFELNQACRIVTEAFGGNCPFLVGSSLEKRDYRDVDVRLILDDEEFGRLFGSVDAVAYNPLWSLMCSSISLWLSKHSGLPVDFQIQQRTAANEDKGQRQAIGIFLSTPATITWEAKADAASPPDPTSESV